MSIEIEANDPYAHHVAGTVKSSKIGDLLIHLSIDSRSCGRTRSARITAMSQQPRAITSTSKDLCP